MNAQMRWFSTPSNPKTSQKLMFRNMKKTNLKLLFLLLGLIIFTTASAIQAQMISGAIFTTETSCTATNRNFFESKDAVYLNGGPTHRGAAGLPDGSYYVQITAPDGTVLGTSLETGNETPAVSFGGEMLTCYQMWSLLRKASDGTMGYDDTPNPGGEYKVWVSLSRDFNPSLSKTDNFKVKENPTGAPLPIAKLNSKKFYDANVNGINDENSTLIGWKVCVTDQIDIIRYTTSELLVEPGDFSVFFFSPNEANWKSTTTTINNVSLTDGDDKTVESGAVVLGAGGGHTIGFWSNKNGQATITPNDFTGVGTYYALNTKPFYTNSWFKSTPVGFGNSKANIKSYVLNANAVDMRYMLSAQTTAMMLNVNHGFVNPKAFVYVPGVPSANEFGFATIEALLFDAAQALSNPTRTRAELEIIKTAIDKGNNNLNFVQPMPTGFTF